MNSISYNVPLALHTTFGVPASAERYFPIKSEDELLQILPALNKDHFLILGGGSNILFTQNFSGDVIHNQITGKNVVKEDKEHVYVKVGAGEVWHEFVLYSIENGWGGVENLSLIPGNVGASPMQNIGAYGVEIKDVFHQLEAVAIKDGSKKTFNKEECAFGYRESVFKKELKNQYIITSVTYVLSKKPTLNTSYGAINEELNNAGVQSPTIKDVSDAVIKIRQTKLPDPSKIGNAGSFFKNPIITNDQLKEIQEKHPKIVSYPVDDDHSKVAAGWLIDQAGWKGKTFGNFGVHKNQALVLVNLGGAFGQDIYELSERIIDDIHHKFGIQLEREVNIY